MMADCQDFQFTLNERRVDCRNGAYLEPGTVVIASSQDVGVGTVARATTENWDRFRELGFAWLPSVREAIWLSELPCLEIAQKSLCARLESYSNTVRTNFAAWSGRFPEFAQLQDSATRSGLFSCFKRDLKLDGIEDITDKLRVSFRDFLLRSGGLPAKLCDTIRSNQLKNDLSRQFLECFESLQSISVWRLMSRGEKFRAYAVLAVCTPVSFEPPQTSTGTASVHVLPASSTFATSLVSSLWETLYDVDGATPDARLYASLVSLNDWTDVKGWVNDNSWVMVAAPAGDDFTDRSGWRCLSPQTFSKNETLHKFLELFQPANFHTDVARVRKQIIAFHEDIAYRGDIRVLDVSHQLKMPEDVVSDAFHYLNGTDSLETYIVNDDGEEQLAIQKK